MLVILFIFIHSTKVANFYSFPSKIPEKLNTLCAVRFAPL